MTNPDGSQTVNSGGFGGGADVIGAAIGAAAGLYDSYQNRKTSKENTDKTIAANKREAELAYQRSIEQWNAQNQYNDPQSQMQRFIAAGLNPHLIYGQGSSGLASSPPQYQAADMQHRYEAPQYGSAIGSILPTLMAVGTWMQNMRLSEAELSSKETNTEKARQLITFLESKNPLALKQNENALSLFPYQRDMLNTGRITALNKLAELQSNYRLKFGDDLWSDLPFAPGSNQSGKPLGGLSKLKYLQEQSATSIKSSEAKLKEAQASWTDFDITNPQAIIQLVMQGLFSLAGSSLKLNQKRRTVTHELEHRAPSGRVNIRRRTYNQ